MFRLRALQKVSTIGLGNGMFYQCIQKQPFHRKYQFIIKTFWFNKFVNINAWKETCFEINKILIFDATFNKTECNKGFKVISVKKMNGHKKTHNIVVLTCCADGTNLLPFFLFKKKNLQKGVFVHVYSKCWMDKVRIKFWIQNKWEKCPGQKTSSQFRSYEKEGGRIEDPVNLFQGGLPRQLELLDVSVKKSFKANVWDIKISG